MSVRRLLLIRHAKSSWRHENLEDLYRPLNERGYDDAIQLSKHLLDCMYVPQSIVCSPAVRTYSTGAIICSEINHPINMMRIDSRLYDSDVERYLQVIRSLPTKHRISAIIGHNEIISDLLSFLTGSVEIRLPTGSLAVIQTELRSWRSIKPKGSKLEHYFEPLHQENA